MMRHLFPVTVTILGLVAACSESQPLVQLEGCRDDMDCPGGSVCLRGDAGLRCVTILDAGAPTTGTPALALSAETLDFGAPLPSAATTRELILTSVGDVPLEVYEVRLIEDDALAEFSVAAPDVPATLAPGESTTVAVTLIPVDSEEDRGYVLVGSSDPARAAALIPLVSWVKGLPVLEACVDLAAPPTNCADPPAFDFGAVDYGTSATRVARLRNANEGNALLTVTAITAPEPPAVPTSLFTVEAFTLEGGVEVAASLPVLLGPQQSTPDLYLRLGFNGAIDRALPSMYVAVATEGTATSSTQIPISWTINGCPDGWRDLRSDIPGCEYACPVWPSVTETCNNVDDDCDGVVDNGFDLTSDEENCGYCGHRCELLHATSTCDNAICTIVGCADGYANVNGTHADGCEYQCPVWPAVAEACNSIDDDCDGQTDEDFPLQSDPHNCGVCGNDCLVQGLVCSSGACVLTCPPGTTNCSGACVDLDTDPEHCGTCAKVCAFAHATATCIDRTCVMGPCLPGYANLDRSDGNGCEHTCEVWPPVAEVCNNQDDDCDGQTDETFDKLNDPQNCGTCGHACSYPHAQALCVNGQCRMGACDPGYRDLTGGDADGCEYQCPVWPPQDEVCNDKDDDCDGQTDETFDFVNDPANCGECNHSCALPGTQVACVSGGCQIVGCLAGYYDLNGGTDGCEYHCATNPPSVEVCNHKDDDCDGQTDEGYDTLTDPNNCGDCGIKCGSSQICCAGTCVVNDEVNCGYCGRACGVGVSCYGGSCIEPGIVIVTEMLIDPSGVADTQGEWIEVFNTTAYPVNLRGWTLRDDGTDSHVITDDVWVPALGFAVLGLNANYASNGGVVVDYQYASFSLGNSGDEVVLQVPLSPLVVVDRVNYNSSFDSVGKSKQLDPDHFSSVDNDTLTNWCSTSTAHLLPDGDTGTPGAPNEQCP
ncbi:MAG: lamin tail domain-containing protein [Deltaproteobacteria bacterium]|nr:lamin tail domain-containing protein [Deltaproteobacteria bacterium]